jgi:hypothetical protein
MKDDKNETSSEGPQKVRSIKGPCCPLCDEEDNLWKKLPCGHTMCTHCMVYKSKKSTIEKKKMCPMPDCEETFIKISPATFLVRRYWKSNGPSRSLITTMDFRFRTDNHSDKQYRLGLELATEEKLRGKRKRYEKDDEIRFKRKGQIRERAGELLTHKEEKDVLRGDVKFTEQEKLRKKFKEEKEKIKDNNIMLRTRICILYGVIFLLVIVFSIFHLGVQKECPTFDYSKLSFELIPKIK